MKSSRGAFFYPIIRRWFILCLSDRTFVRAPFRAIWRPPLTPQPPQPVVVMMIAAGNY